MGQSIGNLFRFLLGANCQTVSMVLFANLHTPFQLSVCLCRLCLSLCFLYFSAACVNLSFTLCLLWIFHLFFADMFIACAYLSLVPTLPDRSLLKSFLCSSIGSRFPHSASFLNLCLLSLSSFSSILVGSLLPSLPLGHKDIFILWDYFTHQGPVKKPACSGSTFTES